MPRAKCRRYELNGTPKRSEAMAWLGAGVKYVSRSAFQNGTSRGVPWSVSASIAEDVN